MATEIREHFKGFFRINDCEYYFIEVFWRNWRHKRHQSYNRVHQSAYPYIRLWHIYSEFLVLLLNCSIAWISDVQCIEGPGGGWSNQQIISPMLNEPSSDAQEPNRRPIAQNPTTLGSPELLECFARMNAVKIDCKRGIGCAEHSQHSNAHYLSFIRLICVSV